MEKESIRLSEKNFPDLELLPEGFYARNTHDVARELLGKILIVRSRPSYDFGDPRAGVTMARIVETETYVTGDPAAHFYRGETRRCSVVFRDPGHAYVYFIYGNYEMLNFVTEKPGTPGAVLIRALEPLAGESLMAKRRSGRPRKEWTSGPGRLCRAMGVRMSHNGHSLRGPSLYVVDDGTTPDGIMASPRVGISVAQDAYWRYFIEKHPFVSRVKENALARRVRSPLNG